MYKLILSLLVSCSLFADFKWSGVNYSINSFSQELAAFELLKELRLDGDESILDIGCGDGKITQELSHLVPKGQVIGVDISTTQIEIAKKRESKNLTFDQKDVENISYKQEFDLITSFTTLQWVPNQLKSLKAICHALKTNGKFAMTMPIGITWQLSEAVRVVTSKNKWKNFSFKEKQYFFSREGYASLLRDAGFKIESFKILPSFHIFEDRESFTEFAKQLLPCVQDVPEGQQEEFMEQVIETYLEFLPYNEMGEVFFDKYVYHIIASPKLT